MISIPLVLSVAGCSENDGEGETSPNTAEDDSGSNTEETDTETNTEVNTGTDTEADTGTDSPSDSGTGESAFTDLQIDGEEFIVKLNSDALDGAQKLIVTYPNDEDSKEITGGIDTYRFPLTRSNRSEVIARPGTWEVKIQDDERNAITSTGFEAERNFSISSIGTLAQQGVKDENEAVEHTSIQFTLTNDGPMPVAIEEYPRLNTSFFSRPAMSGKEHELEVVTEGEEKTTEPIFKNIFRETSQEDVKERAGKSYQGTLLYSLTPTGDRNLPLTIKFGESVESSENYYYYNKPTEINFREEDA